MAGTKVSVRIDEPSVATTTVPPDGNGTLELAEGFAAVCVPPGAPGKIDGGWTSGTPDTGW